MNSPLHLFSFSPLLAVAAVDGWILGFSALTVIATIWMGFRSAKKSKTASDFFVAGRSVSVGWNASAISGEYLSAASFMGIAGMVMSSGYDALWYPVCYACGYLFLLLFIAGPLRRFGAYTIPDFAEGRFDSPLFRKIAVVFVLFIGFFYTMPQMKGAGTTLAYIFQDVDLRGVLPDFLLGHDPGGHPAKGLPYWAGVVLVGAVITLNVALGGMKGITLVQAFQYWAKMFAISVPIFVLMAVYGHYGKQVRVQNLPVIEPEYFTTITSGELKGSIAVNGFIFSSNTEERRDEGFQPPRDYQFTYALRNPHGPVVIGGTNFALPGRYFKHLSDRAAVGFLSQAIQEAIWVHTNIQLKTDLGPFEVQRGDRRSDAEKIEAFLGSHGYHLQRHPTFGLRLMPSALANDPRFSPPLTNQLTQTQRMLPQKAPSDYQWLNPFGPLTTKAAKNAAAAIGKRGTNEVGRAVLSAPGLAGAQASSRRGEDTAPYPAIPLRSDITPEQHLTVALDSPTVAQALAVYAELTGRKLVPNTNSVVERVDDLLNGKLSQLKLITRGATPDSGVRFHSDGLFTAGEVKAVIEAQLRTNGLAVVAVGDKTFGIEKREKGEEEKRSASSGSLPLSSSTAAAEKAWLAKHEKPLALLYTYSLIIAIVCGTAGLPHILVRFYTNPDGAAAKRTTMWVMILIGVFYLFPPVFGVMGRNLMPELYAGAGAKGTDKIVLELPKVLDRVSEKGRKGEEGKGSELSPAPFLPFSSAAGTETKPSKRFPWGSILSGITCAGAFAAFMSTFSGLLVSMTGALAHDVYGRMLRPNATPEQRLRMFKIGAVILGTGAIIAGTFVEQLQINFMVGQAFAIAAASYFPLLFMAVWWRKLTMKGAATGMLAGGLLALTGISLTSFSDLKWLDLADFWAANPLLRILCEQPAIWAVPLAIALMIVISKLTAREVPGDIRMKMLVLHAPEQLGLKQEYIQEHQPH